MAHQTLGCTGYRRHDGQHDQKGLASIKGPGGQFPDGCKSAELILIPKSGILDESQVKSFRPISLLPVLGKALETIIIHKIEKETTLKKHTEQHGFTTGRSTSSALEEVYNWVDASSAKHIFGTFLDITGAFDNVKWAPLLTQLINLGA